LQQYLLEGSSHAENNSQCSLREADNEELGGDAERWKIPGATFLISTNDLVSIFFIYRTNNDNTPLAFQGCCPNVTPYLVKPS
jgi:hypothetical protein